MNNIQTNFNSMKKYSDLNKDQIDQLIYLLDTNLNNLFDQMEFEINNFLGELNIAKDDLHNLNLTPDELDEKWKQIDKKFSEREEEIKKTIAKRAEICLKIFNNIIFEANIGYLSYKSIRLREYLHLVKEKTFDIKELASILGEKNDFFQELRDLNASIQDSQHKNYNFYVEGFPVTLFGINLTGAKEEDQIIKRIVNCISLAIKQIKEKGLGQALNKHFQLGKKINIVYKGKDEATNTGWYNKEDGDISILAEDLFYEDPVYTFCHEFGHAYYFNNIGNLGREQWAAEIKETKIDDFHVHKFLEILYKFCNKKISDAKKIQNLNKKIFDKNKDYEEFKSIIESFPEGLEKRIFQKFLKWLNSNNSNLFNTFDSKKQNADSLGLILEITIATLGDYLLQKIDINKFILEEDLTNYAMTHPDETFAEAFAIYVADGPQKVAPKTRAKLIQMCSVPGMELKRASSKNKLNKRVKIFNLFIKT